MISRAFVIVQRLTEYRKLFMREPFSKRWLASIIIFFLTIGMSGCVSKKYVTVSPEETDWYGIGFREGCAAGNLAAGDGGYHWVIDHTLYRKNESYRTGWRKGFYNCIGPLNLTAQTQKAVQLMGFSGDRKDIYEAVLTSYFINQKEGKAFAVNPMRRSWHFWVFGKYSNEYAAQKALQKCEGNCILFAVGDEIVWEKELAAWKKQKSAFQ
jgi:hypothetical protein